MLLGKRKWKRDSSNRYKASAEYTAQQEKRIEKNEQKGEIDLVDFLKRARYNLNVPDREVNAALCSDLFLFLRRKSP